MCPRWLICVFFTVSLAIIGAKGETPRVAVTVLLSANVSGIIFFTETENGLHVNGTITGLEEGSYGVHIHESGNIITCATTGSHFDIEGNNHGAREHDVRHIGDFGNIIFDSNRTARVDFFDKIASLRGANNILGRAVVLHEGEDDLGLTDHPESLVTGNAGRRVACGVIGISSPLTSWNSAGAPVSSIILLVAPLFMLL